MKNTWDQLEAKAFRPAFALEQARALEALRALLEQQLEGWQGRKAEALQQLARLKYGGGS